MFDSPGWCRAERSSSDAGASGSETSRRRQRSGRRRKRRSDCSSSLPVEQQQPTMAGILCRESPVAVGRSRSPVFASGRRESQSKW